MSADTLNRTQSFRPKSAEYPEGVAQNWIYIDATDWVLGRLSSTIATLLMGKHKPQYTPHADVGDYVVVVNCDKITITGNKRKQNQKHRHTGYRLKSVTLEERMAQDAGQVVLEAVRNMLGKTRLGRQQLKKLKAYAGSEHKHQAQKLIPYQSREAS